MVKKKIMAGIMSAMLIAGMAVPVSAADQTNQNGNTTVTYTQENSYTVSIPATTLSSTAQTSQTVSATSVDIAPGYCLQVTIQGIEDGKVTLTRSDERATTTATVSTDADGLSIIDRDTVIAEFTGNSTAFANGTTGMLYFSAISSGTRAGTYTGTITYQLSVVDEDEV